MTGTIRIFSMGIFCMCMCVCVCVRVCALILVSGVSCVSCKALSSSIAACSSESLHVGGSKCMTRNQEFPECLSIIKKLSPHFLCLLPTDLMNNSHIYIFSLSYFSPDQAKHYTGYNGMQQWKLPRCLGKRDCQHPHLFRSARFVRLSCCLCDCGVCACV